MARTLNHAISVAGVGIHTGVDARVTLHPAPNGQGIIFERDGKAVPALAANVVDTARCTVLGTNGTTVSTVEHLLSACAALGVTDACVAIDGPELPIGDGSANLWVNALNEAGLTERAAATPWKLQKPLLLTGKGGSFIAAYPSDTLTLTVSIHFDHPLVGTQVARYESDAHRYASEIAPARTFGFIEEVEALIAAGLAKGGSFDNAIIIYPDHTSSPLRFADELARHKLLDVLGDLWLSGAELPQADIIAVKPSHRLNTEFAGSLAEERAAA